MKKLLFLILSILICYQIEAQVTDNQVLNIIFQRKSVRHYTGRVVGMDTLLILAKAGMAAPTAMNRQPWDFILVNRATLLDSLREGLPYAKFLHQAGACIIVCGNTGDGKSGIQGDFWIMDCSAASENILLAAESMRLGACWTAAYPDENRVKHIKETLKMPEGVIPLNVIVVGVPTGEDKPKDKYKPEKIHKNGWK